MLFELQTVLHRLNFKGEQHETLRNGSFSRVRAFRFRFGGRCSVYWFTHAGEYTRAEHYRNSDPDDP
jgi:hypothetical protein